MSDPQVPLVSDKPVSLLDSKTILVLEDEPTVMKFMRHILKQYRVIEATTAQEALLLFIDYDHQVDLLLTDVTLPNLSGIQVALLLRNTLPELPVILTSGYPVDSWCIRDSADLNRLGPLSVTIMQKPFQPDELSNAVRDLIGASASEPATYPSDERRQPGRVLRLPRTA